MSSSPKLAARHFAIVICVLTSVACGLGGLLAWNESKKVRELNGELNAQISELESAIAARQQKANEEREAQRVLVRELEQRIAELGRVAQDQNRRNKEKPPSEPQESVIRWIDALGKRVWINLGETDGIKPGITFGVKWKAHSKPRLGFATGTAGNIKGSIEVTRILAGNVSEARIVKENVYYPMAKGDPIVASLPSNDPTQ